MKMINAIIDQINQIDPKFKKLITFNQKQTADAIGVSSSTLEDWRRKSIGPNYIKVEAGKKGRVLYPKTAIAEWLLSHSIKTA